MRIRTENFGALGPGTFEAELTTGLTAVLGPNGSGKSTLVEALYFAVTGELLRPTKLDDIISWGAANMSVKLEGDDFTIERALVKGQQVKVIFTRGNVTLTRKTEVDEALMIRFGLLDKSAFKQIYFAEQFRAVEIFEGADSNRLALLTALFGFSKFEKARKALQETANTLYTSRVDDSLFQTLSDNVSELRDRRKSILADIDLVSFSVLSEGALLEFSNVSKMMSSEAYTALEERLTEARRLAAEAKEAFDKLPPRVSKEVRDKLNEVENFIKLSAEFEDSEREKEEFGQPVSPSCSSISNLRKELAVNRSMLERDIVELNKRLTIVQGGRCPLTGGAPCADLTAMTDPGAINAEVLEHRSRLDAIDADTQNLDVMFSEAKAKEDKATEVRARYNTIRERIMPMMHLASEDVAALRKQVLESDELEDERGRLGRDVGIYESQVDSLQKEFDSATSAGSVPLEKIKEAADKVKLHEQSKLIIKELRKKLEETEQMLAAAEDALSKAVVQNTRAANGQKIKDILNKARSVLHKDSLPRRLIDCFKAEINAKQSQYLNCFNFKYAVSWGSGGSLYYVNDIGELTPVSLLSGGQKYVLLTAFRCALADVFHSRFPLMVLDEPTTGLDTDSREQLSQALPLIADVLGKRGVSVVIPTHDAVLLPTANIVSID